MICKDCGKELPLDSFYHYYEQKINRLHIESRCKKCLAIHRAGIKKTYAQPKKRKVTSNTEELERVNKEAWESGMSYGQYVAKKYQEEQKRIKRLQELGD